MKIRSDLLALTMAALVGAAPAPAEILPAATAPDGAEPPHQQEQDEASFSDEELKTFVVAVIEVQRINDDYLNKLGSATNREEEEQMLQSAANEMTQAVEKNGMSVDRFAEILSHTQTSPQLASRVRKKLKDLH